MVLFRSGTKEWTHVKFVVFLPQNSAFAKGVYFCLFLLGPKNDYFILGPPLKKETFFWQYMEYFFKTMVCYAEHWLAKFEFVNGVLTY